MVPADSHSRAGKLRQDGLHSLSGNAVQPLFALCPLRFDLEAREVETRRKELGHELCRLLRLVGAIGCNRLPGLEAREKPTPRIVECEVEGPQLGGRRRFSFCPIGLQTHDRCAHRASGTFHCGGRLLRHKPEKLDAECDGSLRRTVSSGALTNKVSPVLRTGTRRRRENSLSS